MALVFCNGKIRQAKLDAECRETCSACEEVQKADGYGKAIACYTEAIRQNPYCTEAYSGRGNAYANAGDYDMAIDDFDEAIRLNPNDAETYNTGLPRISVSATMAWPSRTTTRQYG